MPQKRGFTLIELLVVVSIMAILALIGLLTYSLILKTARDGKRQSDLKFIQSALEEYHGDQKFYPTIGGNCSSSGRLNIGCPLKDPNGTKTYLNLVPKDPSAANPQYLYQAKPGSPAQCDNDTSGKCSDYCLWAKLEIPPPSPLPTTPNCSITPANYNYLVTPP